MLEYILRSVHCLYGVIGLPANLLLIVAILFERDTGLKISITPIYEIQSKIQTYSIILFNVAVTDLICIITDLLTMTRFLVNIFPLTRIPFRIVSRAPWVVFLYQVQARHNVNFTRQIQGPCTSYGDNFCFLSHDIMVHLFFHSILLIAISFWYR